MSSQEDKITRWFARQSGIDSDKFPIGIGDDMAQLNLGGEKSVLITTDMLLDGVHFDLKLCGMERAGYKAMAASLSDCAAMATVPAAAVVSVALAKNLGSEALKQLYKGIVRAGKMFDCELIGGDITSWDKPFAISVAMLSTPAGTEPLRRDTAGAGEYLCVTGTLGGAGEGKHLDFVPRVKEAIIIAKAGASAMMDISDGLSTDLNRLCSSSGVGAVIEAAAVPVSEAAGQREEPLKAALNDGEDFELLFTIAASDFNKLTAEWNMDTPITKIGSTTGSKQVCIIRAGGGKEQLCAGGFDHLENAE